MIPVKKVSLYVLGENAGEEVSGILNGKYSRSLSLSPFLPSSFHPSLPLSVWMCFHE